MDNHKEILKDRNYIEIPMMDSGLPQKPNQKVENTTGFAVPQRVEMVKVVVWDENWQPYYVFVPKF